MNTNKRTLKLYWEQIRKHKVSYFLAFIMIPLGVLAIDTLLPYFLSQTIGGLSDGNDHIVWTSLTLAAGIGIAGAIFNFIGFQALIHHEGNVRAELGNASFARLMNKDMRFFVDEKVGGLTSKFIDFIRSHTTLQDLLIIRTSGFVLSISIGLLIVLSQSWILALIIVALLTGLVMQVRWSIKRRAVWRHERKTLNSDINGNIADAITNNLVVKTFAGEEREIEHITQKNNRYRELFKKDVGFVAREGSARVALMVIVQIVAVSACTYLVLHDQMKVAAVIFTLAYLQRIGSQLFTLGEMLNGYDQALLEAGPMSDILTKETTVNDKEKAVALHKITPTIHFDTVSFKYDDAENDILKDIDLSIKAGEKIGLVGPSGAGKTTITHLLLRFSDVTGGTITIDGHNIQDVTQKSLRQTIAYVPQEPMLFHRTLRENIAYGRPNATDKEIRQAAKHANALEFIDELPHKLDTLVGERGIKLSGGQRQRIAIARAILKDAPILILDEATSALDSGSEKLIQAALEQLMKNRTSIVVAHRLSTIQKMDRIIVLDKGMIIEQGSHDELLRHKGVYSKLWMHQSGGFIEE